MCQDCRYVCVVGPCCYCVTVRGLITHGCKGLSQEKVYVSGLQVCLFFLYNFVLRTMFWLRAGVKLNLSLHLFMNIIITIIDSVCRGFELVAPADLQACSMLSACRRQPVLQVVCRTLNTLSPVSLRCVTCAAGWQSCSGALGARPCLPSYPR
jgi:hypothetical protein